MLLDTQTQVIYGDALKTIPLLPERYFDAIITAPPYASGGRTLAEKQKPTSEKYTGTKKHCAMPDFEGDTLDQRSWARWMAEILRLGRGACKPGAVLCSFIDWRQLPSLTDAMQWAGWCWRGIVAWDKRSSRPQKGRFRQQTEYIVWGSNGAMPIDRPVPVLPGFYQVLPPTSGERRHQTEKPIELLQSLVRICVPGGTILDPFCGSGTTLHAAALEGYRAVGIDSLLHNVEVARERLSECTVKENVEA